MLKEIYDKEDLKALS